MMNTTTWSKLGIVLLSAALMSACGNVSQAKTGEATTAAVTAADSETAAIVQLAKIGVKDLVEFKDKDTNTAWSADNSTMIQMAGTSATVTGSGAKASDGSVTITAGGTYVLSGTLDDGQVVVNVEDKEDVHLVLNGVELHDEDSAPVYIQKAGDVILTLQDGTENVITDGDAYVYPDESTDEPNAAVFSKSDLTINGTGKLSVTGNFNDGITSKDDLKIVSGSITVQAADDGLVGRDMVAVKEGNVTVKAGGDGIKSTNDEDAAKGFVAIAGGTFDIEAGADGIQAETSLVVDGGTYTLLTGGGNTKGEVKTGDQGQGGPWGGRGGQPGEPPASAPADAASATTIPPAKSQPEITLAAASGDQTATATEETESQSKKGLKAGGSINVNDGNFSIDSADDSVHSNSSVGIYGGTFEIATGDDGVHADAEVVIAGGTINISKSYEGVEGANITVSGGETHVTATDDGVNVAGGNDASSANGSATQDRFSETASNKLSITGGYLSVDAAGDGLDSNGSIEMSGGTVVVSGPTSNGNGMLDYDGTFEMSGGILAAAGSSGMAQAPSDSSSQYSIAMTFSDTQQAGTPVHLEDSQGNAILTFAPGKNYQTVVISSPDLKKGSYTLYTGGTSTGALKDGVYTGGAYSGGTKAVSFEITDSVTTWLNESGVTTGNTGNRGFGGGGGGKRPGGRGTAGDGTMMPPGDGTDAGAGSLGQ
ncbi:carbohydrate-binding domain-containing protein [Paenibacillus sp. DYY-L-2]|uniref:carbohydrate-binding domain-containing protein n=1 Tax=Paenibacillus sp. DYY-L-2 TaxID=3447013 RepID=UPI003F4FA320